jgi:predicted ATPase/DNA-binding SARP family transcriptional activator/tetratricopeptide (TPR) repeat protein
MGVEFRILGSIEVGDGDQRVDLGGPRERTLLARLLLAAGQVVSADRIAEDIWAGDPPPQAPSTLRVYVSRLRRALGPAGASAVQTQPPGYRLQLEPGQLDADRFASLAASARADLAAGRPAAAAAGMAAALALWRGPALGDIADLAFAQADVARLEEARLAALEDRIEADLACGRHASVASELDGLTREHPLRERLCGLRMLALYRCGRQADALTAYAELRAQLADELGIDPNPGLLRLHESILQQRPELDWQPGPPEPDGGGPQGQAAGAPAQAEGAAWPAGAGPRPPALPAETTSFIGRESDLATIEELLGLSRLLTLTGPGGSGKTRLALRAAAQAAGRHPGGVWLVELAQLTGPELVEPLTATTLGVREQPGRTLTEAIIAWAVDRDLLLVLDNCEHVLDAVADLASALLRGCPGLRIMATSQSRLGVSGEATWPVPPLALPPPGELDLAAVGAAEAVRLFCDRAGLARPGFTLTEGNVAEVSEICRRLDGIPLALELAAARLNALGTGQLAARLDDRFRLLAGASRGGLPRHRTLQAAIEWSHELLSEKEQICLRRLAVFAGSCTLEAAEEVCPGGALAPQDVFPTVTALVEKSLLTADERLGSMRYGLLESVYQFARQKLTEAGEVSELSQRQLGWLRGLAAAADLTGPDQGAWLDVLDAELDNIQAGLEWGVTAAPGPMLELAGALASFWQARGHIGLGRSWLVAALAAAGPHADPALRAIALDGAGRLAGVHADHQAQRRYQEESLAIWRELGDAARVAACLGDLGTVAHIFGEYPAARAMFAEALDLATGAGAPLETGAALSGLGRLALHTGDLDGATEYYRAAMDTFSGAGDLRRASLILGNLGVVALDQGDFALAAERFGKHLANVRELGDPKLVAGTLTNLGMVMQYEGDLDRAQELHTEALTQARDLGDRRLMAVALTNLGLVALARKQFGAARGYHLRSLELAETAGELRSVAESLAEIAQVDAAEGSPERAAVLFGAAAALRAGIGAPVPGPERDRLQASVDAARESLGGAAFQAAWARGEALETAAAIALTRRASPPPAAPAAPVAPAPAAQEPAANGPAEAGRPATVP